MPCKITPTEIEDVLLIEQPLFKDHRGYFTEIFTPHLLKEMGISENFVQDNMSCSSKGTMRGLHFQIEPHGQGKLVRTISGSIFDVGVDLRKGSPTFAKWVGCELSEDNGFALWIPSGFAHGFVALEDETRVLYKTTSTWAPEAERSLLYSDPAIGIRWPAEPTLVSDKDAAAPPLSSAEFNFVYRSTS